MATAQAVLLAWDAACLAYAKHLVDQGWGGPTDNWVVMFDNLKAFRPLLPDPPPAPDALVKHLQTVTPDFEFSVFPSATGRQGICIRHLPVAAEAKPTRRPSSSASSRRRRSRGPKNPNEKKE